MVFTFTLEECKQDEIQRHLILIKYQDRTSELKEIKGTFNHILEYFRPTRVHWALKKFKAIQSVKILGVINEKKTD